MRRLVIKGALYYDNESEMILIPHYTGEFDIVDCDKYIKLDALKDSYNDNYIDDVIDNPIEFEGENYYYAEYSPKSVLDDWVLLSDLYYLEHIEENVSF